MYLSKRSIILALVADVLLGGCKPRSQPSTVQEIDIARDLQPIPSRDLVKILESNELSCPEESKQQLINLLTTNRNPDTRVTELSFDVAASNIKDIRTWTSLSITAPYVDDGSTPVESYPQVSYLDSMEFMECFKHITFFHLAFAKLRSGRLGMITALKDLKHLSISHSFIESFNGIESLTKLRKLTLLHANTTKSTQLIGLIFLEDLTIYGSPQLKDIIGIGALPELRRLELTQNDIEDVGPISHAPSLETLVLDDNKVRTLDNLKGLPSLTELNLPENCSKFPASLSEMPALMRLEMPYNNTSTLPVNVESKTLQVLDISFNRITDISPIYSWKMPALRVLKLDEVNAKALDATKMKIAMPNAKIISTPSAHPSIASKGEFWGGSVRDLAEALRIRREICQ